MDKPVAAIILAAGGSKRFGSPKQLLKWKGQYLINRVIDLAIKSRLDPIFVVMGADYESIRNKIRKKSSIKLINNYEWEIGQSTSLILAVKEIQQLNLPFIVLLCDQPQLEVENVTTIVDRYYENNYDIVITGVGKKLLPPVIFNPSCIPGILKLKGDRGAKAIIENYNSCTVEVQDQRLSIDIDTPGDFEKLKSLY
jgi:molybdenum cofactor cytidylyltransferase